MKAKYVSSEQVICPVPTPGIYIVSISNNRLIWSVNISIVLYNPLCNECTLLGCTRKVSKNIILYFVL